MKYILTVIVCLAILAGGAVLYAWTGAYNIAATTSHWDITTAIINLVRDRSIAVRSDGNEVPNLDVPQYRRAALDHFHGMCRHCHGAPGNNPNEFAEGLYPSPPDLTSGAVQKARGDAEMYWIVKHGIKATGMPAFGPTHDEKELWGMVALTRAIPRMSAAQYAQEISRSSTNAAGEAHTHGDSRKQGDPNHSEGSEAHAPEDGHAHD